MFIADELICYISVHLCYWGTTCTICLSWENLAVPACPLRQKTKNKQTNKQKNHDFSALLKSVLRFLYQNGKHSCVFFAAHRTVFSPCITMHTIICHHLGWHCPARSLCPGSSPDSGNCTPWFGCCVLCVHAQGWPGHLVAEEPPWWCGAVDGWIES